MKFVHDAHCVCQSTVVMFASNEPKRLNAAQHAQRRHAIAANRHSDNKHLKALYSSLHEAPQRHPRRRPNVYKRKLLRRNPF